MAVTRTREGTRGTGSVSTAACRPAAGRAAGRMPGRTVAISGRVRDRMGATMIPPKAGLCWRMRSWASISRSIASPVRPRPSRAATRGARSRPRTVEPRRTRRGARTRIAWARTAACASVVYGSRVGSSATSTRSAPAAASAAACTAPGPITTASTRPPRPAARSAALVRSSAVTDRMPSRPDSTTTQMLGPAPGARPGSGRRSSPRSSAPRSRRRAASARACASGLSPGTSSPRRVISTGSTPATHVGDPAAPTSSAAMPRSATVSVAIDFVAAAWRSTLDGKRSSARSSAAVTTAGSAPVTVSNPSSVSRSAVNVPAGSISRRRAQVTCGRSRSSATSGPTWPVSASVLARPKRITSGASRRSAPASA